MPRSWVVTEVDDDAPAPGRAPAGGLSLRGKAIIAGSITAVLLLHGCGHRTAKTPPALPARSTPARPTPAHS